MNRLRLLGLLLCCVTLSMWMPAGATRAAGTVTVQGIVTSEAGSALPGAFVDINGFSGRTDTAGRFTVSLSSAATLLAVAWAPGFQQRVEFLQSVGGGPLVGTVALNFTGGYALASVLTNAMDGAVLTHLPLQTPVSAHLLSVSGVSHVPLNPTAYVTVPSGRVHMYFIHRAGNGFSLRIPLHGKGAYVIGIYTTTGLPVFEVPIFHAVAPFPPGLPDLKPDPPHAGGSLLADMALKLINAARERARLSPLALQSQIARAALAHTLDMVQHQYFNSHPHAGSNGSTPTQRVHAAGFPAKLVSEAIGTGENVGLAIQVILNSPFHRHIVLGRYRWIGIGVDRRGELTYVTVDVAR